MTDVQDAVRSLREAGKDRTALLAVTAQNAFLLRARHDAQSPSLKDSSAQQRALDVVQLHKLILEEIIGMSEEDIRGAEASEVHSRRRRSHRRGTQRRGTSRVPDESGAHGASARHRVRRRSAAAEVHRLLSQDAERADDLFARRGGEVGGEKSRSEMASRRGVAAVDGDLDEYPAELCRPYGTQA